VYRNWWFQFDKNRFAGATKSCNSQQMSLIKYLAFTLVAVAPLLSRDARGAVSQPSGESMPQPVGDKELAVICSREFPDGRTAVQRRAVNQCTNLTANYTPEQSAISLLGLFNYNQEAGMLDPVRDAYTTPGTFSPQCGLTGTIVMHGGDCKNALAWYNAVENPTAPPAANELYELVPGNLTKPPAPMVCGPNDMCCEDNDFCPLATRMHNQAPNQHTWRNPLPEYAGNIRTDARWKGGLIGFALVPPKDPNTGMPMGICPQIHYSQKELNEKSTAAGTAGMPWIVSLVYQSKIDPGAYYLAFEDQPTCPTAWRGGNCGRGNGENDGDFNDFVFYVKGLSCKGGGQPCTVAGQQGICARGATQCAAGGMSTTCVQVVQPSAEKCDAVDNDCNGMVDEGANLCGTDEVCSEGRCRHFCNDSEFRCGSGLMCDSSDGLCKDRGCIGMRCSAGQVCQLGVCVGGCDPPVKCPEGQDCRLGNCVSPCEGITCPADKVCEGGACQPLCSDKCRSCDTGTMCDMRTGSATYGHCLPTGCQNTTCAAGQVCVAGSCQDGCTGVTCPGGQVCMAGRCMLVAMPDAGVPPAGTGGGGGFILVGTGGAGGNNSVGVGGSIGPLGGGGNGGSAPMRGQISTCKCETAEGPGAGGVALLIAGVGIAAGRRRRAAARARPSAR
jgi:MYXO-CTERM domain-containing protein